MTVVQSPHSFELYQGMRRTFQAILALLTLAAEFTTGGSNNFITALTVVQSPPSFKPYQGMQRMFQAILALPTLATEFRTGGG